MRIKDIFDRPMHEYTILGWYLRLWKRDDLCKPYAYSKYGLYLVGGGVFGAMIWPPRGTQKVRVALGYNWKATFWWRISIITVGALLIVWSILK